MAYPAVVVMVVHIHHQAVVEAEEEERSIHSDNTPAVVDAFVPEESASLVVAPAAVMDHMAADNTDPEEVAYQAVARPMEEVVEYPVVVVAALHCHPLHPFPPTLHSTAPNSSDVFPPSPSVSLRYVAVPIQHLVHPSFHSDPTLMHILPFGLSLRIGYPLVLLLVIVLTFAVLQ